jgi:hypothetical protein
MEKNTRFAHQLTTEILKITMMMQEDYPVRYDHLDETPLFLCDYSGIRIDELQEYLDTIRLQLPTP